MLNASSKQQGPPLFEMHSRFLLVKNPIYLSGNLRLGQNPQRGFTFASKHFSVAAAEKDVLFDEQKWQYRWLHTGLGSQLTQRLLVGGYGRWLVREGSPKVSPSSYGQGSFESGKDQVWRFGLWLMWRAKHWQISLRREGLSTYYSHLGSPLGSSRTTIAFMRRWKNSILKLSYSLPDYMLANDLTKNHEKSSIPKSFLNQKINDESASPWGELALELNYVLNPRVVLSSSYAVSGKSYTVGGSWLWQGLELFYAFAVNAKLQQSHKFAVAYTWNSTYRHIRPKKKQKSDNKDRWYGYGRIPLVHAGCKTLRYFYNTRCSAQEDKKISRRSKSRAKSSKKYNRQKQSRRYNKKRPVLSLSRLVRAGMDTAKAYHIFQLWSRGESFEDIAQKLTLSRQEKHILRRFRR